MPNPLGIQKMGNIKLYDKKRIVIIIASLIGGVFYFLGYKYHREGIITSIDIICAGIALIIGIIIVVIIVRHANKVE